MTLYKWSQTASADATADSTINWAEGQSPSSVNDSARAMMAATAKYRDDIAGGITTGGSATAYTVASFQLFDTLAHLSNQKIAFVPHATNTNAAGVDVTLNVDGLGVKPIRMAPGIAIPNGTLVLGTPYVVTYNHLDSAFYLQNMTNPYSIPLAAGMDYWGTTAPNTSFAFPIGQAISRATYATLFAIVGTTYGSGDGSTTFNLPDKTGRVSAMKEASATRLTTAGGGVDGATMGSAAGTQNGTILQANLPAVTLTTNITDPGHSHSDGKAASETNFGGTNAGSQISWAGGALSTGTSTTGITASTPLGGSGTVFKLVQPTIVCNYIIRII